MKAGGIWNSTVGSLGETAPFALLLPRGEERQVLHVELAAIRARVREVAAHLLAGAAQLLAVDVRDRHRQGFQRAPARMF